MKYRIAVLLLLLSIKSYAQYDHLNIDMLGNFHDSTVLAEPTYGIKYQACWGWVDSVGREYGIIGSSAGTYILNVSNPSNPVLCDYIPSAHDSLIWHEYKTYGNLLYILCDNAGTKFQIADLSYLPDSVHLVYDSDSLFQHAHTLSIDGDKLYVASVQEQTQYSPMNVYSLANPAMPVLLRELFYDFPLINQVHDMFVVNDTIYASAGFDGLFIFRYDSVANHFIMLSSLQDNTNIYNHSSVLSPDHKYLYVCEEIPDGQPVKVIDVSDVAHPFVDTTFYSHTGATPHNPSVLNNKLIIAYYQDGVYVYDITNPRIPVLEGYFDSFPANVTGTYPHPSYAGSWSTYNDLPSGIMLNGDMQSGLFILDWTQINSVKKINDSNISLYPNPAVDQIIIRNAGNSQITIYDCTGRMVETFSGIGDNTRINVSNLQNGIYFVSIQDGNKSMNEKFIKQ